MQEPNPDNVAPPLPAVNDVIIEGEFTQAELLALGQLAPEAESPEVAAIFQESKKEAELAEALRAIAEQEELALALEMSQQNQPAAVEVAKEDKHANENERAVQLHANVPNWDTILQESAKMAADHKKALEALEEQEEKALQEAIAASQRSVVMIFSEAKPAAAAKKPVAEKKGESEAERTAREARAAVMERRTADAKTAQKAREVARQAEAYKNADRTPGSGLPKVSKK